MKASEDVEGPALPESPVEDSSLPLPWLPVVEVPFVDSVVVVEDVAEPEVVVVVLVDEDVLVEELLSDSVSS